MFVASSNCALYPLTVLFCLIARFFIILLQTASPVPTTVPTTCPFSHYFFPYLVSSCCVGVHSSAFSCISRHESPSTTPPSRSTAEIGPSGLKAIAGAIAKHDATVMHLMQQSRGSTEIITPPTLKEFILETLDLVLLVSLRFPE